MKWHLKVILTIINLCILGYAVFCIANILAFFTSFEIGRFESLREVVVDDYFHRPLDTPSPLVVYLFILLNIALHLYLIYILLVTRKSISRIYSGEIINDQQPKAFKRAGAGFVIYAKLRYILLMFMGVFFMNDVQILILALPHFLAFYLLGKIFLVISAIADRGRDLQLENELTI